MTGIVIADWWIFVALTTAAPAAAICCVACYYIFIFVCYLIYSSLFVLRFAVSLCVVPSLCV